MDSDEYSYDEYNTAKYEDNEKKKKKKNKENELKERNVIKTLEKYRELDDRLRYVTTDDIYKRKYSSTNYTCYDQSVNDFVDEITYILGINRQQLLNNVINIIEKYYIYDNNNYRTK